MTLELASLAALPAAMQQSNFLPSTVMTMAGKPLGLPLQVAVHEADLAFFFAGPPLAPRSPASAAATLQLQIQSMMPSRFTIRFVICLLIATIWSLSNAIQSH